ncbi:Caspase-like domain containing protein [Parasponia andersonii]|uniref:Caspase-like domain containing protein n=1 Tax=Parasponia andersonii TaxID=3476 RepID=A0A2P5C4G1_PARAD|nr:Caspase-like domain containing protein [Parasponia andersonii]
MELRTTTTSTTATCSKYCTSDSNHRPPERMYCHCSRCETGSNYVCSKGFHSYCERHSDLFRVVKDFISKFKHMDRPTDVNSYSSLNTKPSPAEMLSARRWNKRALLCGVTYKRKYTLKGTVNDVKDMRELLIKQYNYPPHCIRVLTEFEPEKEFHPTKKNIENSLKWLVEGCQFGDSLVFYFSGHGLRQPDFKNDEVDGFDETICPVDFMEQGMIFDNDINITIVRPLVEGVILHAIVDACHSGTILDLQFVYDHKNKRWEDHTPRSGARKTTSGGLAICISACEDHQLAADTTAFTGKTMNGASTYIFIDLVKRYPNLTYGELVDLLSDTFEENAANNQVKCLNSRRLARLFRHRISQKPLLSSSAEFDIYSRKFSL